MTRKKLKMHRHDSRNVLKSDVLFIRYHMRSHCSYHMDHNCQWQQSRPSWEIRIYHMLLTCALVPSQLPNPNLIFHAFQCWRPVKMAVLQAMNRKDTKCLLLIDLNCCHPILNMEFFIKFVILSNTFSPLKLGDYKKDNSCSVYLMCRGQQLQMKA